MQQETQLTEQETTLMGALRATEREQERRELLEQENSELAVELDKARTQLMQQETTLMDALKAKEREQECREQLEQESNELAEKLENLRRNAGGPGKQT